jgi:hypothetical protein
MMMTQRIDLRTLLGNDEGKSDDRLALFAWLNLGIVESLTKGILKPEEAVRIFFHGDNCLFVRTEFGEETAEEIMSRGVQLNDIFETLATERAEHEFQTELSVMRSLSLSILQSERIAA